MLRKMMMMGEEGEEEECGRWCGDVQGIWGLPPPTSIEIAITTD